MFLFLNKQYYHSCNFSVQRDVIPYANHVHQNKGISLTRIRNSWVVTAIDMQTRPAWLTYRKTKIEIICPKKSMRYRNLNIPVIQQQLKHEIWNQVPRFHHRQSKQKQNAYWCYS